MAKETKTQKVPVEKQNATAKEQKAFNDRFKKATKGKDLTMVARDINNQFEQYRTAEVVSRVKRMAQGKLIDNAMLEAIEKL